MGLHQCVSHQRGGVFTTLALFSDTFLDKSPNHGLRQPKSCSRRILGEKVLSSSVRVWERPWLVPFFETPNILKQRDQGKEWKQEERNREKGNNYSIFLGFLFLKIFIFNCCHFNNNKKIYYWAITPKVPIQALQNGEAWANSLQPLPLPSQPLLPLMERGSEWCWDVASGGS